MMEIRVGKLADALGVHRNTVRNWIRSGALEAIPALGKKYAIERMNSPGFFAPKASRATGSPDLWKTYPQTATPGFPCFKTTL